MSVILDARRARRQLWFVFRRIQFYGVIMADTVEAARADAIKAWGEGGYAIMDYTTARQTLEAATHVEVDGENPA